MSIAEKVAEQIREAMAQRAAIDRNISRLVAYASLPENPQKAEIVFDNSTSVVLRSSAYRGASEEERELYEFAKPELTALLKKIRAFSAGQLALEEIE